MFCEVIREDDVPLLNEAIWHTFYYHDQARNHQGLIQQLMGQQRCAMMMAKQIMARGVGYRYAVRVRPDLAFFAPFPAIATLVHAGVSSIRFANQDLCCCGNEDSFGVGEFLPMTLYFNRIIGLHHVSAGYLQANAWTAESFLIEYMQTNFGVAVQEDKSVVACVVKPLYRVHNSDP
jgi:hypothetical protein